MQLGELLGEHGVEDAGFVVGGEAFGGELFAEFGHAGREDVGGAAFDGGLAGAVFDEFDQLGRDRAGGAAIFVEGDVGGGGGDGFPAAELHVEHGLGADDLGGGGDERNPAEGFADVENLGHDFLEFVAHVLLF